MAIPILVDLQLTQITPFVFVSAGEPSPQIEQVFSHGIQCVINVAGELPQIVFPANSGIESLKYPIEDLPTFPAVWYFDTIADRIASHVAANRRTLIYCHRGRSRSITFILAYLIKYHRLPLPTALTLVREQRQFALPNIGFWSQLKAYDLSQQEKNSFKIILPSYQRIVDGMKEFLLDRFTDHSLHRPRLPIRTFYPLYENVFLRSK